MFKIDFEKFRREDGSIDLVTAWLTSGGPPNSEAGKGIDFLEEVQKIYPINSRQAAAIAIAVADKL